MCSLSNPSNAGEENTKLEAGGRGGRGSASYENGLCERSRTNNYEGGREGGSGPFS